MRLAENRLLNSNILCVVVLKMFLAGRMSGVAKAEVIPGTDLVASVYNSAPFFSSAENEFAVAAALLNCCWGVV